MPSSRQDKVCNALTLVGLVAVIVFGTASLWPDRAPSPKAQPAETVGAAGQAQPSDTLAEVPLVETQPQTQRAKADTVARRDTMHVAKPTPADTAHTAAPHHRKETEPHSTAAPEKAEKHAEPAPAAKASPKSEKKEHEASE